MIDEKSINEAKSLLETPNDLFYSYLWIAEISNYYPKKIVVAVTETKSGGIRGVLLPSSLSSGIDKSDETLISTYVNLNNWEDPVSKALQSISLLPQGEGGVVVDDESKVYAFKLVVFSRKLTTFLNYRLGPVREKSLVVLWEALRLAIKSVANAYQDEKIKACVSSDWS